MYKAKNDVPVFLIFFNRPDIFRHVFEAVKKARPTKLFLACDGPRPGKPSDEENIRKCKKIAEDIDWECEVYKSYSDINLGCGMRMYSGISWAFEYVDRLLIFEDDCVPSQDFFPFCQELLERYKDDDRIYMIDAMNHLGEYHAVDASYFFGQPCCWGWATWKRAWTKVEYNMEFCNNPYYLECVQKKLPYYRNAIARGNMLKAKLEEGEKLSLWTYQNGMAMALQSQMAIVPSDDMITNIGLTEDSGHAVNKLEKLSKRQQQYYGQPFGSMSFPLKHPKYMVEDLMYYEEVEKKFKPTAFSRIEGYMRRIIYADQGEIKELIKKIPNKILRKEKRKNGR
mgnify:FL=1